MASKKVTITLPEELVETLKEEVESGRADSVSSLVCEAVAGRLQSDRLGEVLAEMRAAIGAPTEEDRAWVESVLAR